MIRCTPMYVTDIQRNIGQMTVRPSRPSGPLGPLPLVRQDYIAQSAAQKIQTLWRSMIHDMEPFGGNIGGAFDSWYGYYPNVCATKIQALVRGYQARVRLPMVRMTRWISDNIV